MCDQTEISYKPGDIVWVKLSYVWWPAAICNPEDLPTGILKSFKKHPIAIVKFFHEDGLEYVQKLTNIYHYNCFRKNEFIKKGLDRLRSKNMCSPSNMKLFPKDIVYAEFQTGGDPDILQNKVFEPEEKLSYAELFSNKKNTPKKTKIGVQEKRSDVIQQNEYRSPRLITHFRFVSSEKELRYEARVREQHPLRAECDIDDDTPPRSYCCLECDFKTIRLNVLILHNKRTHLGTCDFFPSSSGMSTERKSITLSANQNSGNTKKRKLSVKSPAATNATPSTLGRKRGRPKTGVAPQIFSLIEESKNDLVISSIPKEKPIEKYQCDSFKDSLLDDWTELEDESADISDKNENEVTQKPKNIDITEKSIIKNVYFDFDDSEDQLDINRSKINFDREIPRLTKNNSPILPQNIEKDIDIMVDVNNEKVEMEMDSDMNATEIDDSIKVRRDPAVTCEKTPEFIYKDSALIAGELLLMNETSTIEPNIFDNEDVIDIVETIEGISCEDSENEIESHDPDDEYDEMETIEEVIIHEGDSNEMSENYSDYEELRTENMIKNTDVNSNSEFIGDQLSRISFESKNSEESLIELYTNSLNNGDYTVPISMSERASNMSSYESSIMNDDSSRSLSEKDDENSCSPVILSEEVRLNCNILRSEVIKPSMIQNEADSDILHLQLTEDNLITSEVSKRNSHVKKGQIRDSIEAADNVLPGNSLRRDVLYQILDDPNVLELNIDPRDEIIEKVDPLVSDSDSTNIAYKNSTLMNSTIISS